MQNTTPSYQYDFLAIGESLIDIISNEIVESLEDANSFKRFIGGQATNLTMNISRLGKRTALATCIGDDGFGKYIQEQLTQSQVDTTFVQVTTSAPTTISIISRSKGTPDFLTLRGADGFIASSPALLEAVANSRIVHTSAFALSRKPTRTTIFDALEIAHNNNNLISLDPNYHPYNWSDISRFVDILKEVYQFVDITKPSLDDCERIFGSGKEPLEYGEQFIEWGADSVVLTMGPEGVLVLSSDGSKYHIQPSHTEVADITGAGDAFWAGLLTTIMDGFPLIEAARVGQALAEIKIGTFGPLSNLPDPKYIYEQAKSVPYSSIADKTS